MAANQTFLLSDHSPRFESDIERLICDALLAFREKICRVLNYSCQYTTKEQYPCVGENLTPHREAEQRQRHLNQQENLMT
ncbi:MULTISPECIES: hypothetical protein [unclassified Halomonas]|uniref:hypothetical protein n=1 Tax=unclassified Halomonas TaxID=2609666 RepID=UPI0007F0F985|nr:MULTISPECIES: hypothetical protein [unclassified Halomonas]SBR45720.1 hypothetical protein GA0071314_0373 [Halomonas sp. HL-93]SNY98416.1 hypothetical protein SAMN04488142_3038 [Halomonas sp. hl-4]